MITMFNELSHVLLGSFSLRPNVRVLELLSTVVIWMTGIDGRSPAVVEWRDGNSIKKPRMYYDVSHGV